MTESPQFDVDQAAARPKRKAAQLGLWDVVDQRGAEDPEYLTRQLLTYIGNKRALLGEIGAAVQKVKQRLGKNRLSTLDAFAGSGVVSRFLKAHSSSLISNDLEDYAAVVGRCYLRNGSSVRIKELQASLEYLNARADREDLGPGIVEDLYAPRDEANIGPTDRVFYTRRNARRIDNYRRSLPEVAEDLRDMCLAPLLSEASVHANTSGVFKGFYKDKKTGLGRFGGSNGDALQRIRGEIELCMPVLSRFECDVYVRQRDANDLAKEVSGLDLAYFDPPYNQHPYGSNYFMLNLIVRYEKPNELSSVSGIPPDWQRSDYNVRSRVLTRLRDLFASVDSRFLLVSFNDEGFVKRAEMEALLREFGRLDVMETRYNTFRGSRNLRNRKLHVTEQLFLLERG